MHQILLVDAYFSELLKFEVNSGTCKDFRIDSSEETGYTHQDRLCKTVYDVYASSLGVIKSNDVRAFGRSYRVYVTVLKVQ